MAAALIVTCPECEKRFKPKTDVSGKKIKCPFCSEPFVVPAAKEEHAEAIQAAKPEAARPDDIPDLAAEPDEDINPYGVKTVELVPRCPNCTQEMGAHDTICLACGYNTMTRTWGKTEKTLGITTHRHFMYLLPAMGSAAFVFFSIVFLVYYCVVSPYQVMDIPGVRLTDHESIRMWTTVILLGVLWGAGIYCFKRFIEKPKPDEIELD